MILAQVTPADTMIQQVADTVQQSMDSAAQAVADSAAAIAAAAATAPAAAEPVVKELSVWDLTMAGGWLMIPLALLAVVSIYIFFERLFAINRANRQDHSFMERIKDYIHRGDVDQALKLCHLDFKIINSRRNHNLRFLYDGNGTMHLCTRVLPVFTIMFEPIKLNNLH